MQTKLDFHNRFYMVGPQHADIKIYELRDSCQQIQRMTAMKTFDWATYCLPYEFS